MIDYTALDDVLIAKVKSLFNKLYRKGHKVRLLGVRFSHLIPFTIQMNLFDQSEEKLQLYKAVDKILRSVLSSENAIFQNIILLI